MSLGVSIFLLVVGAILTFAVDVTTSGFNLNTVGIILMVGGLLGLLVSALFLTSYVIYHLNAGSVPFRKTGWIRTVYFAVLIPHVILAAAIVPMVLITVSRAWSKRFDKHRRIARWTLPLWLYVSITGVIVYLMLYQM